MHRFLLILILFLPTISFADGITGSYEGSITNRNKPEVLKGKLEGKVDKSIAALKRSVKIEVENLNLSRKILKLLQLPQAIPIRSKS